MAQQHERDLYLTTKLRFLFPTGHDDYELSSTNFKPGDVVIVIRYKGMKRTIVQLVNNLKLNGVHSLSFTSFDENVLRQAANYNLYYDVINNSTWADKKA